MNEVRYALPDDVLILHIPNVYVFTWSREKWGKDRRLWVLNQLLDMMYDSFRFFVDNKTAHQDPYKSRTWDEIGKFCALYRDTSLQQWLSSDYGKVGKIKANDRAYQKRIMVIDLIHGDSFPMILDDMFGKGTYDGYLKRHSSIIKGQESNRKTRKFMEDYMGFDHKGFGNHRHFGCGGEIYSPWSVKEIRKMTASERIDIRAQVKYNRMHGIWGDDIFGEDRRWYEAYERAMKFLGITDKDIHNRWRSDSSYFVPERIVDNEGKTIFDTNLYRRTVRADGSPNRWINFPDEITKLLNYNIDIDSKFYEQFCESKDKFNFRKRFWQRMEIVNRRLRGFWLRECITDNPDLELYGDDNHILNEMIVRIERYQEEERERIRILNAEREERERERREEERRSQMRRIEMMESYKNGGLDGVRQMYWSRECQLPIEIRYNEDINYGGNVLLRLAKQEGVVETSKGIRMTFQECHKYWEIIKEWHDKGTFKKNVQMAGYTVNSFDNDILTAGCHRIAFCEIERCYKEMCAKEAA
jgi:hypothetical protein